MTESTEIAVGLVFAFVSALGVNWAYAQEHDAVTGMQRFSARRPLRFVTTLVRDRRWVVGFGVESASWLVYVAALLLAPIALVQAVCASGIAFDVKVAHFACVSSMTWIDPSATTMQAAVSSVKAGLFVAPTAS